MSGQSEKVKEILEKLEQGIEELIDSDKYKAFLKVMASFPTYSVRNCLLISMQTNGEATYVCGFKNWEKLGRYVKKGEKGIEILAPCPVKKLVEVEDEENQQVEIQEVVYNRYRPVYVFDISQTEGEPLKSITQKLEGRVKDYDDYISALRKCTNAKVSFEDVTGTANGFYNKAANVIVVDKEMDEQMRIKTLIHEVAHSILHSFGGEQQDASRDIKEVEAESVAYVVCQHFGIDAKQYSFGYIAGWAGGDIKALKDCLEHVQLTARKIIDGMEAELEAIRIERSLSMASVNVAEQKELLEEHSQIKSRRRGMRI